ncbi:DUF883 family protein [Pseudoroseicyclus tamaricis]|uniref:DUF883 family protein n=1 Tax=Pseudoroseicyclus tamaricis TaxID=2705421 RepID=A0A6B2JJ63_9RHOB|nr:DUF883 family protein [Pseudoroseicyclus tamaricis]NDV01453.1 DUF883 family protein [Pseudoroseicyclus tamaricis]
MARATSSNATNDEPSMSDFMKQFDALKADLAQLSEAAAEIGAQQKEMLKVNASSNVAALRQRGEATVTELTAAARRAAGEAATEAEAKVRENPAAAIGLATFFGFLVGLILSRRN